MRSIGSMRSISRCTDNSPASNFSAGRRSGRVMNPISRSAGPAAERDRKADVTFVGRFPSLPSEPKNAAAMSTSPVRRRTWSRRPGHAQEPLAPTELPSDAPKRATMTEMLSMPPASRACLTRSSAPMQSEASAWVKSPSSTRSLSPSEQRSRLAPRREAGSCRMWGRKGRGFETLPPNACVIACVVRRPPWVVAPRRGRTGERRRG